MNSSPSYNTAEVIKRSTTRQRKSTLTQQQKNKKRQRATTHQLNILKSEFEINQTPNAKVREEIGRRIDMTERSVQIWFQNKRAKNKMLAKKQCTSFPQNIQFTMDTPYFITGSNILSHFSNGMSENISSGTFATPDFLGNAPNFGGNQLSQMHQNYMCSSASLPHSFDVNLQNVSLSCASLSIGSWRRVFSQSNQMSNDLQIVYSPLDNTFTYTIFSQLTGFRIQYSLQNVEKIELVPCGNNQNIGTFCITLSHPPKFFIQTPKLPTWIPCDDFSEMKQASSVLLHKLIGPFSELQSQLNRINIPDSIKITIFNGTGMNSQVPISNSQSYNTPAFISSTGSTVDPTDSVNTAIKAVPVAVQTNLAQQALVANPNENANPIGLVFPAQNQLQLEVPITKTRSKSLSSLDSDLFGIEEISESFPYEPLRLYTGNISAISDVYDQHALNSATSSIFCLNDDATINDHTDISAISSPIDQLISNDQLVTVNVSSATSPTDSFKGKSSSNEGNSIKDTNMLHLIPSRLKNSSNSNTQSSNSEIGLDMFSNNSMVKDSLLTPDIDCGSTSITSHRTDSNSCDLVFSIFDDYMFHNSKESDVFKQEDLPITQQFLECEYTDSTDMIASIEADEKEM